jgi:signal transduction histidine kinase
MRRLYQKIYLTIVASMLAVVLVAGTLWRVGAGVGERSFEQGLEMGGELLAAVLPEARAPPDAQQRGVEELARRLKTDVALFDARGVPIAAAGKALPPPPRSGDGGFMRGREGTVVSFPLPDERSLVIRAPGGPRRPGLGFLLFLGGAAITVALVAYPMARGLTRRLERLQRGVDTLGAGNLATRVEVKGRDEVARLADSFNAAAGRIEQLVDAHRMLLANASHELRTPLSRIRIGVDLLRQTGDPKYEAALIRDIAELDLLVDEILLASRLDATKTLGPRESVDLLALMAEECARYDGAALDGEPITIAGEPRLLRRLVRNLLENAVRHGKPPVNVRLRRTEGKAVLEVLDHGPGIPEAERERVFVPFQQLGPDAKGSGLGLSLVRQIARLHGGDAVVAAGADGANVLRVTLPVA